MSNRFTVSKTLEDDKLLGRLEKLRPKELSKARMVFKAIDYFVQTHKKRPDELIEMGPPNLADDIDIWKSIIEQMTMAQIVDATKKMAQIDGVLRYEATKR